MNNQQILINAYTHKNFGDDLFLKMLFDRYKDADFTLLSKDSSYETIFSDYHLKINARPQSLIENTLVKKIFVKLNRPFWNHLINRYEEKFLTSIRDKVDALVIIGGSLFMEGNNKIVPANNRYKLLQRIFSDKSTFILGANFGPFKSDSFLDFYKTTFSNYTDVCFRDSYSAALFNNLPNVRMAPDIIFGYHIPKVKKKQKTVGFSILDLYYRPDLKEYLSNYENYCVDLMNQYIALGYTVNLFSFCTYEGDTRAIERLYQKLEPDHQKSVNKVFYEGNIDDFLTTYLSTEIMYTTRFHATILSLLGDQEIVPLIYSKKMLNVLDDIGYDGDYINIQDIGNTNDFKKAIPTKFKLDQSIIEKSQNHFSTLDKIINPII